MARFTCQLRETPCFGHESLWSNHCAGIWPGWPRPGWLFSWRCLRGMLIAAAWTATIVALFYGEENWRGRRAWNKYRRELEAHGQHLDLRSFIPNPVPDEQNFTATPFVRSWFVLTNDTW